jgi:4-hydroxy-3-polyprenylbenzoate decarboxylase
MDVLDHSCSKLGFGGKMCIDGTTKFEEEKEEGHKLQAASCKLEAEFSKIISLKFMMSTQVC